MMPSPAATHTRPAGTCGHCGQPIHQYGITDLWTACTGRCGPVVWADRPRNSAGQRLKTGFYPLDLLNEWRLLRQHAALLTEGELPR